MLKFNNLQALLVITDNRLALSKLKGEAVQPFHVNPAGKIYVEQTLAVEPNKQKNKKKK